MDVALTDIQITEMVMKALESLVARIGGYYIRESGFGFEYIKGYLEGIIETVELYKMNQIKRDGDEHE